MKDTFTQTTWAIRFLGVGNSHAIELGSSACVLERNSAPLLMIDCGPDTLDCYGRTYDGRLPEAVFITHTHLDHIGGLERLFYRAYFDPERSDRVKLFVPVRLLESLQKRLGDCSSVLAEGGANFWDGFHLIPVTDQFWHGGLSFSAFPVRHSGFLSAYGVALAGVFLFTGDTLPVPEVVTHFASQGETIFHDCCVEQNPAHTVLSELSQSYESEQLERMIFYHYESENAGLQIEARGYRIVRRGERICLGERSGVPSKDAISDVIVHEVGRGQA